MSKLKSDAELGKEAVTFTLDQFDKDKKKITKQETSLTLDAVVEVNVSNKFKAIAEMTDQQIKDKFNEEIEVAVEFMNGLKKEKGEKPSEFRTFSKAFFKEFRDSISSQVL
jgi:hypothetical protein